MTAVDTVQMLNAEQRAAVEHVSGPLRLIAGAGTGKTHTLTERIAHIVREGLAEPGQILALTFTDKAAAEMSDRIHRTTRRLSRQRVHVDTYNAFGGKVVQEHGHLIGLPPGVRTITPAESWVELWRCIQRDEIRFKHMDLFQLLGWQSPIKKILSLNSRMKDELVSLDQLLADTDDSDPELQDCAEAIRVYEARLRELGAVDFGNQIALAVELLRLDKVREVYARRYRYIMVDEYQDTNYAQSVMVRLLGEAHGNVCVVGDPYQAIYGFRGASPDNLDRFGTEFPKAVTLFLRKNYRSTQPILDAANTVWNGVDGARSEGLVSALDGKTGRRVVEAVLGDRDDEARYIAGEISLLRESGYSYSQMAVLMRKNDLKTLMWRSLRDMGIPVRVAGGSDLFRTPEVREILSYLRAVDDPTDTVSLAHALVCRVWGFDERGLLPVVQAAGRETPLTTVLWEQAALEPEDGPTRGFLNTFNRLLTLRARSSLPRLIEEVIQIRRTCYSEVEEANVRRFKQMAYEFAHNQTERVDLSDLLGYIDLLLAAGSDQDEAQDTSDVDAVQLMTAHAAKGLEWDVVFVAAASDQDFRTTGNSSKDALPARLAHSPQGMPEIENEAALKEWKKQQQALEDRRVFYVALTRARKVLYVTRSRLPTYYRKERTRLEFFKDAHPLCETWEPAEVDRPAPAPAMRAFAEYHVAGMDFQPDPEHELVEAWTRFAVAYGIDSSAGVAREGVALWRRQAETIQGQLDKLLEHAPLDKMPSPTAHRGRPVLSYTHLQAFQQCPRKYYLRYVLAMPGLPERWKTGTGKALHEALARWAAARKESRPVPSDEVVTWFEDGQREGTDTGGVVDTTIHLRAFLDSPQARAEPLMVEEEFYLPVGGSYIHGFIDCVQKLPDGRIELVDYKTDRKLRTEESVRADLQLPIYLLASRHVLRLIPDQATMYFIRFNFPVTLRYSDAELDSYQERVEQLVERIAAVDKDEVNPDHCCWCEYRLACSYSACAGAT